MSVKDHITCKGLRYTGGMVNIKYINYILYYLLFFLKKGI